MSLNKWQWDPVNIENLSKHCDTVLRERSAIVFMLFVNENDANILASGGKDDEF